MDVEDKSTPFDYNDNNISFREHMTHFLANPNPINLDKEIWGPNSDFFNPPNNISTSIVSDNRTFM